MLRKQIDFKKILRFQNTIWDFYKKNKRDLPWRKTRDPYKIVVSEIMLQQTQVSRVLQKYPLFIKTFPNFNSLVHAPLRDILQVWQGMGYNRRALYLKKISQLIVDKYSGLLPNNPKDLETFPGIGKATAGSIVVFVFNKPTVFIETNIRRVFIHFFFANKEKVDDKEIIKLVGETVDAKNPRDWYFALMDYGAMLGKTTDNPNKKSKYYSIQSKFNGSHRQIRGEILRQLLIKPLREKTLIKNLGKDKDIITMLLGDLEKEGLIIQTNGKYFIS